MRSFSGSHSARYLHISASVPPDKTDVRDVHSRTHSPRMHTMGANAGGRSPKPSATAPQCRGQWGARLHRLPPSHPTILSDCDISPAQPI